MLFFKYSQNSTGVVIAWASQVALVVKNPPAHAGDANDEDSVPGSGRCPGEGMVTHSSIIAWEMPWTEEPSGIHGVPQSWTQLKRLSTHTQLSFLSFLKSSNLRFSESK